MRRQRVANAKPGSLAKQLKVESASKVSKAKQEAPEVSRQRLKLLIKRGEESAEQLAALDAATAAREVRQKKITAAVVRACASESIESHVVATQMLCNPLQLKATRDLLTPSSEISTLW